MANRDWQERGVRIAGLLLDESESAALVQELKKCIRDPEVAEEVERFLRGEKKTLSRRTRDTLHLLAAGLLMSMKKQ